MTEEDPLKHDEEELLNKILSDKRKGEKSEDISEELLQPNISELISRPIFKEYNLEERDIKIVSMLFKSLLNSKGEGWVLISLFSISSIPH